MAPPVHFTQDTRNIQHLIMREICLKIAQRNTKVIKEKIFFLIIVLYIVLYIVRI